MRVSTSMILLARYDSSTSMYDGVYAAAPYLKTTAFVFTCSPDAVRTNAVSSARLIHDGHSLGVGGGRANAVVQFLHETQHPSE